MPRKAPDALVDRLKSADRRVSLEAMREALADRIAAPGEDDTLSMIASAVKELRAVQAELDSMQEPEAPAVVDQIAARREAARAGGAIAPVDARRGQPRRSGRSPGAR